MISFVDSVNVSKTDSCIGASVGDGFGTGLGHGLGHGLGLGLGLGTGPGTGTISSGSGTFGQSQFKKLTIIPILLLNITHG